MMPAGEVAKEGHVKPGTSNVSRVSALQTKEATPDLHLAEVTILSRRCKEDSELLKVKVEAIKEARRKQRNLKRVMLGEIASKEC